MLKRTINSNHIKRRKAIYNFQRRTRYFNFHLFVSTIIYSSKLVDPISVYWFFLWQILARRHFYCSANIDIIFFWEINIKSWIALWEYSKNHLYLTVCRWTKCALNIWTWTMNIYYSSISVLFYPMFEIKIYRNDIQYIYRQQEHNVLEAIKTIKLGVFFRKLG